MPGSSKEERGRRLEFIEKGAGKRISRFHFKSDDDAAIFKDPVMKPCRIPVKVARSTPHRLATSSRRVQVAAAEMTKAAESGDPTALSRSAKVRRSIECAASRQGSPAHVGGSGVCEWGAGACPDPPPLPPGPPLLLIDLTFFL